MKYLLLLCVFFSTSLYASEIKGSWRTCHSDERDYHIEHIIKFFSDMRIEMLITHKSKKNKPCEGEELHSFSRGWMVKIEGNEFQSTHIWTAARVLSKNGLSFFNKEKMCNNNDWKVNERVECTNKKMGGLEIPAGYMSRHQYLIKGKSLELTDEKGQMSSYKAI